MIAWFRNWLRAKREGRHSRYYQPRILKYPCPVCDSISFDQKSFDRDLDHCICPVCGVHFGYDDCFGGNDAYGRQVLRKEYEKAGRPDWRIESARLDFKGGVKWLEEFQR